MSWRMTLIAGFLITATGWLMLWAAAGWPAVASGAWVGIIAGGLALCFGCVLSSAAREERDRERALSQRAKV